ncbi:hypothetical protein J2Y55_002430 [Bosea sp. BE125]|uniref:ATP-dependent nuclease n=1 Tax=Bosea sp. BE125 TaxID=2817909 RepID=UPI00285BD8EC|nr:AAA family ATPase [Bosea sp. BE125]MDR6871418.1 hypothetical protein [Bosea sp. BE125]
MPIFWISALILTDMARIELAPNSLVVFVGANNSGKSAALRGIRELLSTLGATSKSAIEQVVLHRAGSLDDLREYMAPFLKLDHYMVEAGGVHVTSLASYWSSTAPSLGALSTAMVSDLSTEVRLGDCQPAQTINFRTDNVRHPFQRMWLDRHLENATSSIIRRAFNCDLVIDRGAGGIIPAYVGDRPERMPDEERGDPSYTDRVQKLQPLEEQGDGMRSFVSIVARVLTEARPVLLIDEPEAFLHPPQARLVGRQLSVDGYDRQTFIATHSSEVLQGLLGGERGASVTVIRLSRAPGSAKAVCLRPEQIAELWKDPILRFSTILDGLFHDGVVVCESDADCRFYEAMIDAVGNSEKQPDLHYVYSGGKDRLHIVVKALADLGLPVSTIVDFDVLNNEATLKRILAAHGGDWEEIRADWQTVKTAIEQHSAFLGGDKFVQAVNMALKRCKQGEAVPREVLSNVRKLTRQASPWDFCKTAGLAAISSGEPQVAVRRLLANLMKTGIFVVPVGEMEGFQRSVGSHGPRWVEEVLRADLANDPNLEEARSFARAITLRFA